MNYAVKILKEEAHLIRKAIKSSDWSKYKEALKTREKRLKEIEEALFVIQDETRYQTKPTYHTA